MQQEANKSPEFISGPLAPSATLRDIFNRLGPRNRSVKQVIANLGARGSHYSKSAVYNVIYGRTVNPGIASEFLNVA